MIKKFTFQNFKSFEYAEFYLENFTTLIGTNASGKSNAIEGIKILSDLANGLDLSVVLDGSRNETVSGIRGGSKGCCHFDSDSFVLGCTVILDDEFDLEYFIRIEVAERVCVLDESLYRISKNDGKKTLIYESKLPVKGSGDIKIECKTPNKGRNRDVLCSRSTSILSQIKYSFPHGENGKDILNFNENIEYIERVIGDLKRVLFLDTIPSSMRDYVRETDIELKPNGSNTSSVLNQLCKDKKKKNHFLKIIKSLPENEITNISFINTKLGDVILALDEKYGKISKKIDAKRLSDGTLRCVAILTALLTEPENSVIIIEEIDNGIHPGRVKGLIENISAIGKERKIDVIITTHSATLLNSLSKENLSGVTVVYRERNNGSSKFQAFVDAPDYVRLTLKGLGDSVIDDSLIDSIKHSEKKESDFSWMEENK